MAAGDDIQDNKLRDLLIDRMREAGIDVVTDVEEGERVLARAGGTAKVGINRRGSDDIRYMLVPDSSTPIYVSNARLALDRIKQEKATGMQWLRMLEKNGGIKAGEDRWTGLSGWLKEKQKESIEKADVRRYIDENRIDVREVRYAENVHEDVAMQKLQDEFSVYYEQERERWYNEVAAANGADYAEDFFYGDIDYDRDEQIADRAFDRMVDDYGDNFRLAFAWYREAGEGYYLEISDPDAAESIIPLQERPIEETRLDYTDGGLTDKREIALTVPTIEPWNPDDAIHFGDADGGRAVAWVRFGDTTINEKDPELQAAGRKLNDFEGDMQEKYDTASNDLLERLTPEERTRYDELVEDAESHRREKRVLVIDEIQSKRHQEGREKGYADKHISENIVRLTKALRKADKEYSDLENKLLIKYNILDGHVLSADEARGKLLEVVTPEEYNHLKELYGVAQETREAKENFEKEKGSLQNLVPDAPFEKTWHELCMKRMLRYAAENGYDRVAWTTGEQQAERYDLGHVVDAVDVSLYQTQSPSEVDGYDVTFITSDRNNIELFVNKDGVVSSAEHPEFNDKHLSEIVGKPLAVRILTEGGGFYQGKDLRVGIDGMKAFYDNIIPNFMNRYAKGWGAHVEDVKLDRLGKTMHSVKVTEQMKRDVMEGQPMFFRRGNRQAYGFVLDGAIYIDPKIATLETPIHEYTHLWAEVLRQNNPREWKSIVEMMKDAPDLWQLVEKNYGTLWEQQLAKGIMTQQEYDSRIADEALAQFSGRRGAERLRQLSKKCETPKGVIDRMSEALNRFWKGVAGFLHIPYKNKEEVADRVLHDLLGKVNPLDYKIDDVRGLREEKDNDLSFNLIDSVNENRNRNGSLEEMPFPDRLNASGKFKKPLENFRKDHPEMLFHEELQIESQNFKSWFGDWQNDPAKASKITDADGKPIVVEHATNADFSVFDMSHIGENSKDNGLFGAGFYFGTHAPGWMQGSKNVMKVYLNIRNPFELDDHVHDMFSEIRDKMDTPAMRGLIVKGFNDHEEFVGTLIDKIKAVDKMIASGEHMELMAKDEELEYTHPNERLKVWRDHEIMHRSGLGSLALSWQSLISEQIGSWQFTAAAMQDGYDGVIADRGSGYKEYVAFEPSQIKSATDNTGLFSKESDDIRYQIKEETIDDKNNMNEKFNEILVPVMTGKEKTELPREGGLCELSDVLSGEITRQDVDRALDSHLVKSWMKAKGQAPSARLGFFVFGIGPVLVREFAKARLGIDNKFEPGKMFYNSWELIEDLISVAKEKGLDVAIANKYVFQAGSEDVQRIMEDPENMYSEQEMAEIKKYLSPAAFEDFTAVVRSLSEAKQIQAEEERIMSYQNGDAVTKAFVLYDIAQRRLFAEHEGDERYFRQQRIWSRPDGSQGILTKAQNATADMTVGTKWVLKNDVARDMMHLIATSPITEQVPLLEKGREQQRVSDVTVHTMKDGKAFVKCKIDGRQQLGKPVKDKDLANYGKVALAEKYFDEELRKNRENKRTIKR